MRRSMTAGGGPRAAVLVAVALGAGLGAAAAVTPLRADVPVTLRGSMSAMTRQHSVALGLGYPFVRTPGEMAALEEQGELVRLEGNEDYGFREGVRSMVARPEMRTFIERLGRDYRAACDERLIVTSLTRPTTRQPRNAHRLSVHPAGIAVDLRVSKRAQCRAWLEDTLLAMEELELLDITRERSPPHYHVALFPDAYMEHVAPAIAAEEAAEAEARARAAALAAAAEARRDELRERPEERRQGSGWLMAVLLPSAAFAAVVLRRSGGERRWP